MSVIISPILHRHIKVKYKPIDYDNSLSIRSCSVLFEEPDPRASSSWLHRCKELNWTYSDLDPCKVQPRSQPASWSIPRELPNTGLSMAPLQSPTQVPLPGLPLVSKLRVLVSFFPQWRVLAPLCRLKKRNLLEGHINESLKKKIKLMNPSYTHPEDKEPFFCIKDFYLWKEICVSEIESPGKRPREVPGGPLRTGLLAMHTFFRGVIENWVQQAYWGLPSTPLWPVPTPKPILKIKWVINYENQKYYTKINFYYKKNAFFFFSEMVKWGKL